MAKKMTEGQIAAIRRRSGRIAARRRPMEILTEISMKKDLAKPEVSGKKRHGSVDQG